MTALSAHGLSRLLIEGRAGPLASSGGVVIDHARFRSDVTANALRLRRAGCRRGLLVTADAYWGAVGLFALWLAGAEAVLPHNVQPGTLEDLRGGWDLLVTDGAALAEPCLRLESGDGGLAPAALDPASPLVVFTSGSTGAPKRVAKTLRHLEREVATVDAALGAAVPAAAWVLATVSHQHAYGLAFRLGWPLASGRPFAGEAHELWETALAALSAEAALITSPAHLNRLEGLAPLPADRRPSLVLSAGAPLPEAAVRMAAAVLGTAPTEIFGSSETGAVALRQRGGDGGAPPWRPLPGNRVERTDSGLMRVRSPYAPNGVFDGADRVEVTADGGFHLLGRADGVVKIEGKRVSLAEVEQQLSRLPWVADAALVVVDGEGEGGGPRLGAAVVPSPAGAARLAGLGPFRFGRLLRRELAATQEPAGLPRLWRFVDRVPTAPLGKRGGATLAALFIEETPVKPTEPAAQALRPVDGGVELDLVIAPDLAALEGHFPDFPIVPGVALLDWAVRNADRHLGLSIGAARNFQVKFRRVITPGRLVTLLLRHEPARRRLNFEYRDGGGILTSGTIKVDGA
ncbi:AMP-binding protein [Azospirillum sp. TSO35-2]|uniref:AMP-binding protein n=1 Tax=Azospirillum sp. TSO35-2 TaxID=716796 RepID=UPI0011B5AF75|nr:AMP-binding protein [Azospirillum sp. TSO35-2]